MSRLIRTGSRRSFWVDVIPVSNDSLPLEILKMRPTGKHFDKMTAVEENRLFAQRFSGAVKIGSTTEEAQEVVISDVLRWEKAKRYRAALDVTLDSQMALDRMLRRHILGVEAYNRGEGLDIDILNKEFNRPNWLNYWSGSGGLFIQGGKSCLLRLGKKPRNYFCGGNQSRNGLHYKKAQKIRRLEDLIYFRCGLSNYHLESFVLLKCLEVRIQERR